MNTTDFDLYIFTEGGKTHGYGHITRCLSLYEEAEFRGVRTVLVINGPRELCELVGDKNIILDEWYNRSKKYLLNSPVSIIDSYLANEDAYLEIAENSSKCAFIDDTNRIEYPHGIVINPSIAGRSLNYSKRCNQEYLVGSNYVILRREFCGEQNRELCIDINDVLIVLGGTDIKLLTANIIEFFNNSRFKNVRKHVVFGSDDVELKKDSNTFIYRKLDANNMRHLMLKCDIAITGAGQTVHELIAVKLPFICIKVIDNQDLNIRGLLFNKIIDDYIDCSSKDLNHNELFAKFIEISDFDYRKKIEVAMNKLNLSKGTSNIMSRILGVNPSAGHILLRKAEIVDCEKVFMLSNCDYVRKYSMNQNKIEWNAHVQWFKKAIDDKDLLYYIIEDVERNFIGQIRFKVSGNAAEVSISIHYKFHGKGIGLCALRQAMENCTLLIPEIRIFVASIHVENTGSNRLFIKAGYKKQDVVDNNFNKYYYRM